MFPGPRGQGFDSSGKGYRRSRVFRGVPFGILGGLLFLLPAAGLGVSGTTSFDSGGARLSLSSVRVVQPVDYPVPPPTISITRIVPTGPGSTWCVHRVELQTHFESYEIPFDAEKMDLMLLLDRSSSMVGSDPNDYTKQAAINLVASIPSYSDVAIGVVLFGQGTLIQPLTTDRNQVQSTLTGLGDRPFGTNIAGAIATAAQELDTDGRVGYNRVMLLVSDGGSDATSAKREADNSTAVISCFFIGVEGSAGNLLLQDIAQRTGGVYAAVTDPGNLPDLFQSAIYHLERKIIRVEVLGDNNTTTTTRAVLQGDRWIAEDVPIPPSGIVVARAHTNELPPREGVDFYEHKVSSLAKGNIAIQDPPSGQVVDLPTLSVSGSVDLFSSGVFLGSLSELDEPIIPTEILIDPCSSLSIDHIEVTSTADPGKVYSVVPADGLWQFDEIPVRPGPRIKTQIVATAVVTGPGAVNLVTSTTVVGAIPCLPIEDVVSDVNEPTWEAYNQIFPFDPFSLSDTPEGLEYELPGPVANGYFGFYQTRDYLCPAPSGLNVMKVRLGPHRSGDALLPDCRVRAFWADNTRSYFCRVNELNQRPLPEFVQVPFISDGYHQLRLAVDLLAFDGKNGGGWTFASPLSVARPWNTPMSTSLGLVSAGTFMGEWSKDVSGSSVTAAGDVNGDGLDDFLIGARDGDRSGPGAGEVYLVLGKRDGWRRWSFIPDADRVYLGESAGDAAGTSLAGVGDVNGDGLDDFVIGAPGNDEAGSNAGKVYLIYGRRDMGGQVHSLAEADVSFLGQSPGDRLGSTVAKAGDVNGDGIPDFAVGAPDRSEGFSHNGKVYLLFGKATGWPSQSSIASAAASFVGEQAEDHAGKALAGVGDVNGDSYADFAIGAAGSDFAAADAGQVYLIFGKSNGWVPGYPLFGAAASFVGESAGDGAGSSVAGAGDVNGDGYADFLIGAPFRTLSTGLSWENQGQVYLLLGKAAGWSLRASLADSDARFAGDVNNCQAGTSVGGVGDVNGDHVDDFAIGAVHADGRMPDTGALYVIPGSRQGWERDNSLSAVPFCFQGERSGDLAGYSVAGVGDVNGDGFDDLVTGAPGNGDAGLNAGHSYLILGSPAGPRFAPVPALAALQPTQGASLQQVLADLNESSWEPYRHIAPFQETPLSDTEDGLDFRVGLSFTMGYFAFYQTRDSFAAPPAGLHDLRVRLKQERVPGYLLPDIRVRVFTADNSVSYYARYTEAAGGALPTEVDVPFVSDGVWPFRVAVDLMSFDTRMYGGWTVTGIELDP